MKKKQQDQWPKVARPWQPRFGILGMLLLMLVTSVMATGGYYFVRTLRGDRNYQLVFILFTVASPLLLLVVVSIAVAILRRKPPRRP
jgi:Na+/melibiose symporter-like transporter